MTPRWYAVHVRSRAEFTVAQYLEYVNYSVFLPTYNDLHRWSDRVKSIRTPFFPGYVFCQMDISMRLPVLQAPGVIHIVSCGKSCVPVPEEEIAAVRALASSPLFVRQCPYLNVGERVVIKRGPLAGVEGILTQFKNNYRLVVSIHLLQRSLGVEVDLADVQPVERRFALAV
jgi:transcription antitermination factor NusG